MNLAVVPVKYLTRAKRRLAGALSPEQRYRLALAMLEDVLQALTHCSTLDQVLVTSPDPGVWEVARRLGAGVIAEEDQWGENAALEAATEVCLQAGAHSMLAISADVPLITPEDVDSILGVEPDGPVVVLVPSRDGLGINALLRRPPDVIPLRFGRDSLRRHLQEATNRGIPHRICPLPRVALDIDFPEDLARFASRESPTRTYRELMDMGVISRGSNPPEGEDGP